METTHTVTVTGHGAASQTPDALTLTIGVETVRSTLTEAYQDAAQSMQAVQHALDTLDISRHDRASSGLSLRAETSWQEGKGNLVTGYNCSSTLTVRLSIENGAQQAIAAIVDAGGNDVRLNALESSISDPSAAAEQARTLAWADAARNAAHFAELANRRLGRVISIDENPGATPSPFRPERVARAALAISLPIEAGESTVSTSIIVSWELI